MLNLKIRKPDEIIGEKYMRRWHLRRKQGSWNLYLHRYDGSDDDRALHDHPWKSISILLCGNLHEVAKNKTYRLWWFLPKYRNAEYAHRIILKSRYAYTLFFTLKKEREWGFHCPQGWKHWKDFTSADGQQTGAGCGEES
ncbi:MAG: hypothetical protein ACRBEE_03255 [Arenicella sp.]